MFDVNEVRKDFPMLQGKTMNGKPLVYFDNAATTFKPQCVIDAVNRFYTEITSNIHRGDYELAYQTDTAYENCRKTVSEFLNCKPEEIVFTSGASASLNLVAYGYGRKFLKKGDVILSTEAEHASNILPWFKVVEETGAVLEYIPLDETGRVTVENFRKVMHDGVKVVTMAAVTNVLGYDAPVKEICAIAHEYGAVVVVDGAQSVPHEKTDVSDLDCDFLAFSSHKLCGPSGIGVLYGKYELLEKTDPFMLGGGSNARFDICGNILLKQPPYKFEAGTPNIEGVLGMDAAIRYLMNLGMDNIHRYEKELHDYLEEKITQLDNIILYNPKGDTGIVTFNVKDIFAQDAAGYLNFQGIAVRSGNHCAKILINFLRVGETIRSSLYFYNTKEEVDQMIEALKTCTIENCVSTFF